MPTIKAKNGNKTYVYLYDTVTNALKINPVIPLNIKKYSEINFNPKNM